MRHPMFACATRTPPPGPSCSDDPVRSPDQIAGRTQVHACCDAGCTSPLPPKRRLRRNPGRRGEGWQCKTSPPPAFGIFGDAASRQAAPAQPELARATEGHARRHAAARRVGTGETKSGSFAPVSVSLTRPGFLPSVLWLSPVSPPVTERDETLRSGSTRTARRARSLPHAERALGKEGSRPGRPNATGIGGADQTPLLARGAGFSRHCSCGFPIEGLPSLHVGR